MEFPNKWKPSLYEDDYHGYILVCVCLILPLKTITHKTVVSCIIIIVFSTLNVLYLNYATHQKERNRDEILAPYITSDKAVEDGGEAAWIDLGDRHPDFQYAF